MAINPPYRFDPLSNLVDANFEEDGDSGGEPGSEDCWALFPSLFIAPCVEPTLRWPTCNPRPEGESQCTDVVAEAAGCNPQCQHWYQDGETIVCYQWGWLSSAECGFAPGPIDNPPTDPPDDWVGHGFSPNSEE